VGRALGPLLVAVGLLLVLLGLLAWMGALSWVGRLPGDIRIERESARLYVPLATMVLISLALTALFYLLRRWL
jgi:hypothetical protein